jgi:hypothetical protein
MSPDHDARLVEALHEHAIGITAQVAAVDLLANHRVWLNGSRLRPVHSAWPLPRHRRAHSHDQVAVAITALGQGRLPCSSSDADVLRIAASLGAGVPVRLRDVLGCLDHRNIAHVVRAIAWANDTWPIDIQGTPS